MNSEVTELRRAFPIFAAVPPPFHYLDNAATAQICHSAAEALHAFETRGRANVKRGVYRLADAATAAFEEARTAVAAYLGTNDPSEIAFTSGTTMGLNLAAHVLSPRLGPGRAIVVSELEHHSNIVPWQMAAERTGAELRVAPVDEEGRLLVDRLEALLDERVAVVAIAHVSNVTGILVDVARVGAAARAVGAVLVVDGAQRVPHGPFDVRALGCDLYAFSGHKMFAATGAGAIWIRRELAEELPPFLGGGEMIARVSFAGTTYARPPHRFEAGTPAIGPVLALGAAARWLLTLNWQTIRRREEALTARLLDGLAALPAIRILGPRDIRDRFGIVAFEVAGLHAHDVCQLLDGFGVCTRGGHHCAQPLMDRFGTVASVRASLAPYNDEADVDALLTGLEVISRKFR